MQIELTKSYVIYQAQSKVLELGNDVAETFKLTKPEVKEKIALATKIRLWLKALQYSTYLDKATIDKLVLCLTELCEANAIPYSPSIVTVARPDILVGIPGSPGGTGPEGPEGGGTPFSYESFSIDTIVDSFPISLAEGVDYSISVSGTSGKRIQRLIGGWSSDGMSYGDDGGDGTDDLYGDTSPITLSLVVTGTTAQLFAQVTSGTWTVKGTRKYIPNNGNGIVIGTSLTNGKIWIGDSSNSPVAQTIAGDISISNAGVSAIATGVIVNADISASAAIALSKLAALATDKALVSDSSGVITTSATTATQLGYLSTTTSDVQVQLNSKLSSTTGAISTVVNTNLTASRAVISNAIGKIAVSNTTDVELGYSSGVTSPIQAQLDDKMPAGLVTSASASYSILSSDYGKIIHLTDTGVRTATLPAASAVLPGRPYWVKDAAGTAGTNAITVQRSGSDTFEDASTSIQIIGDGNVIGIYSDGTSKWYLI